MDPTVNLASSSSVVADTQNSTAARVLPSCKDSTITMLPDILLAAYCLNPEWIAYVQSISHSQRLGDHRTDEQALPKKKERL
jgi:hypothetical protein